MSLLSELCNEKINEQGIVNFYENIKDINVKIKS